MLTFDQARARILADATTPLAPERVALSDAAGRVLAEDVYASAPLPPFDYSAMDGYVLALEDAPAAAPFALPVVGESRTGGDVPARVEPGTACRIFTGAVIPPRGDAVVMQEDVAREGDRAVFQKLPRRGEHIRRAGEDLAQGALALPRGTRLGPAHLALLATLERARVNVARRPVVAILSTGDELREPGDPARVGSVVDSNGPALAAMVRACGGIPRAQPFARDELDATRAALVAALSGADVLLTVGGVSVGDHDVVKPALAGAGIELDFWKVAIKPGKPLAVGRAANGARFLGLPGNPASAMLTFQLFGAPLLRALQGDLAPTPPLLAARLAAPLRHHTGRLEFARARLRPGDDGVYTAEVLTGQSSGSVPSMAWADAFVLVPADQAELPAGATVRVLRVADV